MAKKTIEPDWSQDPPAQEPSFSSPDAPTIQSIDSSSIPSSVPLPPPPPPPMDYGAYPEQQPEKKSKVWIWVVVILAVLLLCCCCTGIIISVALGASNGSYSFMNSSLVISQFLV